jgi:hypothetical protein
MSPRRATSRSWRWRGMYFVTLGAAAAALVAGIAYATAGTGSGTGSATTGSVVVTLNSLPVTNQCSYTNILPGDLPGAAPCTMKVTYAGSIPAFMSLTVTIESRAGSGGHLLYDGTNNPGLHGLTFTISDSGGRSFTVPVTTNLLTGTSCPSGYTCWSVPNELADWYTASTPNSNLQFTNASPAVTWTVTPSFPSSAGGTFQGGTATLILSVQAVQAPANPLPASCTTSTIGFSCPAGGTFTWS